MPEKATSATDLRAKLLRFQPFREKLVKVDVPLEDGTVSEVSVLVRQPSVAQRDRILAEAQGGNAASGKMDGASLSRAQALAAIQCCLDPESRQPLFSEADIEAFVDGPSGGFFDVLSREAMGMMEAAQRTASKSPEG